MKFILHYRGPLRANGSPSDKHKIREIFHEQLKRLWAQQPLLEYQQYLASPPRPGWYSLLRPLSQFTFVPLVTAEMKVIAQLSIILMRPEPPGQIITQGGDIDNRLKTLFDALTMPRHQNALPSGAAPAAGQQPFFFCLFEDDNLVTAVSVKTEQSLEPAIAATDVDLLVQVSTGVTQLTWGNTVFV